MRKWTVRVEDELADDFTALTSSAGVSIQAAFEAFAVFMAEVYNFNNRRPLDEWMRDTPGRPLAVWLHEARAIDAAKRRPPNHDATND